MSDLAVRVIEGWNIYEVDGAEWIKDVELAERAALANPRDIKATIKGLAEDGVLVEFGSVAAADATKTAVFKADRGLVPKGNRGGTQRATTYYLNREAALHVLMKLRTPKAVELQVVVVRVFLLAVEGKLPQHPGLAKVEAQVDLAPIVARLEVFESKLDAIVEGTALARQEVGTLSAGVSVALTILRGQNEQVADLARVVAETRDHLAKTAAQKGLISEEQAAHIRREVDALAVAWVEAGWARNLKSAFGELVQEFFGYVGWGRVGERIDGLPEERYPRALAFLDSQRRSLRRVRKPAKAA